MRTVPQPEGESSLKSSLTEGEANAANEPPPYSPVQQSKIDPQVVDDEAPTGDELSVEKKEMYAKEKGNDTPIAPPAKSETLEPIDAIKEYQSRKVTEAGSSKLIPRAWKRSGM